MSVQSRSAGWVSAHSAALRGRRWLAVVAIGAICFLGGAALGLKTLSPMFVNPPGMSTSVAAPPEQAVVPAPNTITSSRSSAGDRLINGVAFEMEVPRLGYRATVLEGVDAAQLDHGPGHYPTSAWPGQTGNVAIAAHNVYWLSFNRLGPGDRVIIRTPDGVFTYEVTASKVVNPGDNSALDQTAGHTLTLTTCYPLWAGAYATQRLIFTGRQIAASLTNPPPPLGATR